jgi:Arc/MetJ-type ribon-helix-helix transcriptional regulator
MAELRRIDFNLTQQLVDLIDQEVSKGHYKNRTEFITTAIRNHLEYCQLKERGYQKFTLPPQPQPEPEDQNSS